MGIYIYICRHYYNKRAIYMHIKYIYMHIKFYKAIYMRLINGTLFPVTSSSTADSASPLPQFDRWGSLPVVAPWRAVRSFFCGNCTSERNGVRLCCETAKDYRRQWEQPEVGLSLRARAARDRQGGLCSPVEVSPVGLAAILRRCSCVARSSEGWLQRPAAPLPWRLYPKADRRGRRESERWS